MQKQTFPGALRRGRETLQTVSTQRGARSDGGNKERLRAGHSSAALKEATSSAVEGSPGFEDEGSRAEDAENRGVGR
ncbi:hypothetical protein SKAU_G00334350 [Synaphobranchus kaupii]|uniref:Uncharacterized protein n=1 Tax=Synaphobranchus kaupii TaxID=118154 RepID=A0A9Q1IIW4_SYNKA|nr:hypothetical protein SKAU_G00334350 [Synaphobranchus kaupii]